MYERREECGIEYVSIDCSAQDSIESPPSSGRPSSWPPSDQLFVQLNLFAQQSQSSRSTAASIAKKHNWHGLRASRGQCRAEICPAAVRAQVEGNMFHRTLKNSVLNRIEYSSLKIV
jgi:hypothetical protein